MTATPPLVPPPRRRLPPPKRRVFRLDPDETPTSAGRTELESEDSALGMILTDGSGNTLYAFQPDAQGPSTCYDDCASSWPALLVKGELEVSGNDEDPTDARLLDTTDETTAGRR